MNVFLAFLLIIFCFVNAAFAYGLLKNTIKRSQIPLLVLLFVSLFFSGCCFNCGCKDNVQPDLTWEINQLKKMTNQFGIPQSRTSNMNLKELITELQIKINETTCYQSGVLSNDEKLKLRKLLYGQQPILQSLDKYSQFIENVKQKQIIILPDLDD